MVSTKSWLTIPKGSSFSLANLPFGVISTEVAPSPRIATAIGEFALDLSVFAANGGFAGLDTFGQQQLSVFSEPALNAFAALGKSEHYKVRIYLQSIFSENTPHPQILRNNKDLQSKVLIPLSAVCNHIPFLIGDYSDFFVGLHHAEKAAKVFNITLARNYKHLPVGYAGRASSVVVSGTPIHRPQGQIVRQLGAPPVFAPCHDLDFELELACFMCKSNPMGHPIPVDDADDYIFGYVMMNDWSARDMQAWEMGPLGPLNSKNFATTISPWVVTSAALEPFRTGQLPNEHEALPYLREKRQAAVHDIRLWAELKAASGTSTTLCRTNGRYLLWSFSQILAHLSISGCPLNPGDLVACGTVSGPDRASHASLLEINDNGALSLDIGNGESRTFLEDGDTVTFHGVCGDDEYSLVGFGTCAGTILPAINALK
ncbi:hypothetical protein SEUCBS139899_004206 [Sporothrix eucalyptigena]